MQIQHYPEQCLNMGKLFLAELFFCSWRLLRILYLIYWASFNINLRDLEIWHLTSRSCPVNAPLHSSIAFQWSHIYDNNRNKHFIFQYKIAVQERQRVMGVFLGTTPWFSSPIKSSLIRADIFQPSCRSCCATQKQNSIKVWPQISGFKHDIQLEFKVNYPF